MKAPTKKALLVWCIWIILTIIAAQNVMGFIPGCSEDNTDYTEFDTFNRSDSSSLGNTEGQGIAWTDNNGKIQYKSMTYDSGEAANDIDNIAGASNYMWVGPVFNITADTISKQITAPWPFQFLR